MELDDLPAKEYLPHILFSIGIILLVAAFAVSIYGLFAGMGLPLMVLGTILVIAGLYLFKANPF